MTASYKIITAFCVFLFLTGITAVPQRNISPNAEKIAEKILKKSPQEEIRKTIISEINGLSAASEKQIAFEILADYELRAGLFAEAAEHYAVSAEFAEGERQKELFLEALKASIAGGEIEKGYAVYGKLSAITSIPPTAADREALVCLQWLKIAEAPAFQEGNSINSVLNILRKYVTDPNFANMHPAILLTLWWLDNDSTAKNTLIKHFPGSIETEAVKGEIIIKPGTFWYLLPKTESAVKYFEEMERKQKTERESKSPAVPRAYQTGFFQNEEYAKIQAAELRKKGFAVEIKKEKRQSGTTYFAVFVVETQNGKTGMLLKNEGYESFPVFD